jgi:hypothetical protein
MSKAFFKNFAVLNNLFYNHFREIKMKKIITAIFIMVAVTSSLFGQQTDFPRGVFLFGQTKVDFEQMRDSLFINYIQAYTETLSSIPEFVTDNAGLNVLAQSNLFNESSSGQKVIFQAEDNYREPLTFAYWATKETGDDLGSEHRCRRNVDPAGFMVRDAKPDNEYRYNRTDYNATFRMQIEKNLTGNPEVADLIVYCKTHGNELARVTLSYNDFPDDEYYNFVVHFTLETTGQSSEPGGFLTGGDESLLIDEVTCKNVDIRVYWYGLVTTWLDNAIIMDNIGSVLFAGGYDSDIINEAAPYVNNYLNVKRFYTKDEPQISAFLSYNYVDNVFIGLNPSGLNEGRGRSISAMYQGYDKALWFIQDGQPHEYFFDGYVIDSNIPSPSMTDQEAISVGVTPYQNNPQNYTQLLQEKMDYLVQIIVPVTEHCKNNEIPFWYIPQLHGIYYRSNKEYRTPNGEATLRPPTGIEIVTTSNIALAYGAKAIFPYPFGTSYFEENKVFPGLVSAIKINDKEINHWSNYELIDGKVVFTGYSEKWDAYASFNQKLMNFDDELSLLNWIGAKSWQTGNTAGNWIGIISDITTNFPLAAKYVETGHFTYQNTDYIFVVNRRSLLTDEGTITLTINKASSEFNNWSAKEIGTSNIWLFNKTGNFQTSFEPGEGKLFRLEPVILGGGTLVYDETLPAGTNINVKGTVTVGGSAALTIGNNSTLNFFNSSSLNVSGSLTVNGTAQNKVTFNFHQPDDNGIVVKLYGNVYINHTNMYWFSGKWNFGLIK